MRTVVQNLQESKIREVSNVGTGRADVLPFWFGESDEVTPEFIRQAAVESLARGETFYSHNLGMPELRDAIARYMGALHGTSIGAERIAVTSGGVNALMLAVQALVDAGDEVVAVTPIWPNLTAQALIMGARLRCVPLRPVAGAWTLDMEALCAAITPATRVLIVNAPNNPTGWTLTRAEQQRIADHCRATGTWILADEVYERLYYGDDRHDAAPNPGLAGPHEGVQSILERPGDRPAPSFLDVCAADDRLVVVHSFSKSFLMTGWRLGWMVMPPAMTHHMGKLIEFNTSCAPVFVQRAGIAAAERTADVTPRVVAHLRRCRDTLVPLLQAIPEVEAAPADGGMYVFFRIRGHADSLATAKRLVIEAGLGLAPGAAFDPDPLAASAQWLRWCFASRDADRLARGVERLRGWLQAA